MAPVREKYEKKFPFRWSISSIGNKLTQNELQVFRVKLRQAIIKY